MLCNNNRRCITLSSRCDVSNINIINNKNMIVKIYFDSLNQEDNIIIPFNNQKELNSFIYRTLGDNNSYHDSFSDYSISGLQGGKKYDDKNIIFTNSKKPYVQVSSENSKFINDLLIGLSKNKYTFFGLVFSRTEFMDYNVNKRFDTIITLSPVIVKDRTGRKISINDENFLSLLKENCIKKLKHKGIVDDTFDIIIRHPEKARQKMIMVGNIFNICSKISLYVYGKPSTRKTLYNLGLGGSTGSGFGSVMLYN